MGEVDCLFTSSLDANDWFEFSADTIVSEDVAFTLLHDRFNTSTPPTKTCLAAETTSAISMHPRSARISPRNVHAEVITFAEKTYYMVNSCSSLHARWNATGTGFLVLNADGFARDVLPDYFKHHSWTAFVAELKLHGFSMRALCHRKMPVQCFEFRHRHFQRGNPRLIASISRHRTLPALPPVFHAGRPQPSSTEEDAVAQLKYHISALQDDVQQTQDLFGKLLASLIPSAAADQAIPIMVDPLRRQIKPKPSRHHRSTSHAPQPMAAALHPSLSSGKTTQSVASDGPFY